MHDESQILNVQLWTSLLQSRVKINVHNIDWVSQLAGCVFFFAATKVKVAHTGNVESCEKVRPRIRVHAFWYVPFVHSGCYKMLLGTLDNLFRNTCKSCNNISFFRQIILLHFNSFYFIRRTKPFMLSDTSQDYTFIFT